MVGAHQILYDSRDLTMPFSETVCHPRAVLATCLPNVKSLTPPAVKI